MIKKYFFSFLIILLSSMLACFFYCKNKRHKNIATVIILNGPSGAGKTSIQKSFQKIMMPELWIKLGIDSLFDLPLPDISLDNMSYWQSSNNIRWVEEGTDKSNCKTITLLVGKDGEKVAYGMNSAIAAYAQNGCNIIVDYIAYKPEWLNDLKSKLKPFKTYYVAVDISLTILEQREANRGTSPVGHARSHYDTVYGVDSYDLRVDSSKNTSDEIALILKNFLNKK
jgi:chloramphenicol 3-O phosphotransferase